MDDRQEKQFEERIRFLAKHYREGAFDQEKAWKELREKKGIKKIFPFKRYLSVAASVTVLLVAAGTFFLISNHRPDWMVVTTAAGEVKNIWLPDSSFVSLAGHSTLRYDRKKYNRETRRVELTGKGYFEVKPDQVKQFAVYSDLATVTVLGTTFQINDRTNSLQVDVFSGKVSMAVYTEQDPLILTAGMSARYRVEDREPELVPEPGTNQLSWKTGVLNFQNTPISQVIEDLEAYYGVRIVNKEENPSSALNATFEHLPLEDVLLIINQTLDTQLVAK